MRVASAITLASGRSCPIAPGGSDRLRAQIVALTREEKEAILQALEHAPPELQPVRELLLADESWRLRRRL